MNALVGVGVKINQELGLTGAQFGLLMGTPILTGRSFELSSGFGRRRLEMAHPREGFCQPRHAGDQ